MAGDTALVCTQSWVNLRRNANKQQTEQKPLTNKYITVYTNMNEYGIIKKKHGCWDAKIKLKLDAMWTHHQGGYSDTFHAMRPGNTSLWNAKKSG